MAKITRRNAVGAVGGVILLGACVGAGSDDEDDEDDGGDGTDVESSTDDDSNDTDSDSSNGNGQESENSDGENESDSEEGADSEDESDGEEDAVDEPKPQSFSGSGAAVEDDVVIEGGLTVVEATHSGSSNFQVLLVPSEGEYDELFVNDIGTYDGATAALVGADTYQLDVEADGDWSIDIRQPRAASGDALPQTLEGEGPAVLGPFEFGGSHTATGSHSGDSNYQVQVFPTEGMFGELVFNEIGTYDGETTFRHDGIGYVYVQANGPWSLKLE